MKTKITQLSAAHVAAFHEQLRLETARAERLRAQLPGIIARAEAARAAKVAAYPVIRAHWEAAKLRHIARKQLELPLEVEAA